MTYEDITNKKFPDLMKGQATESRCPTVSKYGTISNKMLPKHTTVKWQKNQDKKKILNTAQRKGRALDLTTDLTTRNDRSQWKNIFNNRCQPKILYRAKISIKDEGKIMTSLTNLRVCYH